MAGEYKNSIKLGISLKPTSEVQKELQTAIEQLEKNSAIDLKIDTKQINQSLKDFSETLTNISSQIKNNFNFQGVFTNQVSNVESVTNKLKEEQQVVEQTANVMKTLSTTTTGKSDSNGNITEALKTVEQLQTGIGNTTKLTTDLATGLKTASNTENFQKLDNIVTNLQTKLNTASKNNFVNPSIITELQSKLNGINTNTAEKEFKELQSTINNLGSSDSQIVRLQNTISKMENTLTAMKGKYGSLVGDSSSKAQLDSYIVEIEKLKTLMTSLQNGGTISGSKLASELNQGTEASRNLSTAVKNSSSAFKISQQDATSFGEAIKRSLNNLGLYATEAMAVQKVGEAIKSTAEYVKYLDKAYTDLSITMSVSKEQFSDMTTKIQQMGIASGTSSKTLMEVARVYANETTNVDAVMKKIQPDVWLANVSGMTGENVTKTINAVSNQFKLLNQDESNAEEVTKRIGNSLVSISKNMKMDFAQGVDSLSKAVETSGSTALVAGDSLEKYLSIMGATTEATGKDSTEVANAYKMIASRILQQKELSEEMGTSAEEMAGAEQTLQKFNISIREGNDGALRPLSNILQDLSVKWKNMSDSDKEYTANKMAGVRQMSVFSSMMTSMSRANDMYNASQTDTNALYDAQQKYVDSIQGRLGTLKASIEAIQSKIMSSDSLKWLITEATQLVTALSNVDVKTIAFIGTIGLATVAISKLVTMNKTLMAVQAGEAGIKAVGLTNFIGILTGMTPLMGTTTVATEALTVAQTEATVANEALALAEERLLVANEALTVAQEGQATSSFQIAVAEGEVMLATDALTVAKGEATVATEALTVAESEAVAEQAGLTGLSGVWTLLSTSIKGAVASSLAFMATPIGMAITAITVALGVAIGGFVAYKQHQEELTQQGISLKKSIDGVNEALKNGDTKGASQSLDEARNQQKALEDLINTRKKMEDLPEKDFYGDIGGATKAQSIAQITQKINEQIEVVKKQGLSVDETTGKINELQQAESQIVNQNIVDKIKDETKAQVEHRENTEANTEEYKKYISTVQNLYSEYQNLSSQENLSAEQKTQLASVVEQLQGKIGNLNSQMDDNGKTYITNEGLISDTIGYYNSEGQTVEVLTQIKLADEKNNASWQYNNTSITYNETIKRINDYKSEILAIQQLMNARLASASADISSVDETSSDNDLKEEQIESHYIKTNSADLGKINSLNDEINKLQAGKDAIDKMYTSLTIPSNAGSPSVGTSDYTPSGGGSSKADKSAEDEAKKAEEAEKKTQEWIDKINELNSSIDISPYTEDNNKLEVLASQLQAVKTSQDELTGSELADSKAKENEILQKQIDTYKHLVEMQGYEKDHIASILSNYGVLTDSTGQLTNATQVLAEAQQKANSMSGQSEDEYNAKKSAIEQVKVLNDYIEKYGEITNKTIPETIDKWEQLTSTIKKNNEEMKKANEDLINTEGEKLVNALKQEYEDKKTAELKSLKEEYQSDIDDLQDEIDSKQKQLDSLDDQSIDNQTKLAKLKIELANLQKDNSTEAQGKIQSTQTQISELEKTIKKDSLQKDIDALNKQKSDREDSYNEQVQDTEDMYKDLEDEHKLYNEVTQLLTTKNTKRIKQLLTSQDESFKQIGTKLGEALNKPIQTEVENTITAINNLISKVNELGNISSGGSYGDDSPSPNHYEHTTSSGTHYTDIGTGIISDHPITSGDLSEIDSNSGAHYTTGTTSNGQSYTISDKPFSAESGGRTPSNIDSNGAVGILHANEKILNSKDTIMIDQIYDFVKNSGAIVNQLYGQYSNASNYNIPNIGTDLNKIANSITTNNNDNSNANNININNNYDVKATTDFDTKLFSKNIDKQYKDVLRKAGILKR